MTEQEAIYCLKAVSERYPQVCEECQLYGQTGCDHCYDDANDVAIKALEEIQQYRTLGSFEELRVAKELYDSINKVEDDIWKLGMGCDDLRERIKQIYKQFREAEYNNGWIPCSERLPEDMEEKLVYLSSGRPTIAKYNEHILPHHDCPIGWGYSVPSGYIDFESETVIAWQPLPEPYTPKGE